MRKPVNFSPFIKLPKSVVYLGQGVTNDSYIVISNVSIFSRVVCVCVGGGYK